MFWQKMWEIVHWVVVCSRQSCFVRWIIKWGYGQVWEMESAAEGMGLRVNANGKKSSGSKVDPCGVCGEWVIVILLSVQNVRGGLIIVVLMCLGRWVYYHVGMSSSVEHVLLRVVQ